MSGWICIFIRYGYGSNFDFGGYWEGGVGTRTPDSFNFKQGTLIVDAWDAERHELVWRAIATAALSSNPDNNDKKIEKALKKIMRKWDEAKASYPKMGSCHNLSSESGLRAIKMRL